MIFDFPTKPRQNNMRGGVTPSFSVVAKKISRNLECVTPTFENCLLSGVNKGVYDNLNII